MTIKKTPAGIIIEIQLSIIPEIDHSEINYFVQT